jgi:fatty acid desaturase
MENRDPDLLKLHTFEMKNGGGDSTANAREPTNRGGQWMIPFSLFVFPGQYMGQSVAYLLAAKTRRYSYLSLPNQRQLNEIYDPLDLLGMFVTLVSYEIACIKGNFMYLLLFLVSNNFLYALNVVLDHDTYENVVTNDYKGKDWLRLQIQHSANFVNDDLLWTRLFGSINYQIEHHLFPNVSSYHYPRIKPIVEKYCLDHHIPYVHHPTIQDAVRSFMKTVRLIQIPTSITPF